MKIKVIGCEIFKYLINEEAYPEYDFIFFDIAKHEYPQKLNQTLQTELNASQKYDLIILLYGLCGNAILDLVSSKTDMLVFRSHDCSSILLGKKEQYINHSWSCHMLHKCDYIGNGLQTFESFEQYGEHAEYLYKMLQNDKSIYFIKLDEEKDTNAINSLQKDGYSIKKYVNGSDKVLRSILNRNVHPMIFYLPKGKKIHGVYDFKEIIKAK